MSLNLNASPYFDDFDPNKNFQRILFKPGVGVQARELTQAQTILQDQISKFGSSIYQQNTPVSGGNVTITSCYYLRLKQLYNGSEILASDFLNKTITDTTGKIRAKVIQTTEKVLINNVVIDSPTLYIQYLTNENTPFTDNLQISTEENSLLSAYTFGNSTSNVSTGGSIVSNISSGIFYVLSDYNISNNITNKLGNFVSIEEQTIVASKYTSNANVSIGLTVVDSIYTYNDDNTLLDPALGESNFQGPGADRYTIKLELSSYILGNEPTVGFIKLVEIKEGKLIKQISTQYSNIDNYLAQRTYDTNGDYVVNNFPVLPLYNSLDFSKYDLKIGKGVAYVKGYRVDVQSETILTGDRARDTKLHQNKSINCDYGSYLIVDSVKGSNTYSFDFTTYPSVDLHCVSKNNIDSNRYYSTLIGSVKLRNLDFISNATANTETYIYKAYVCDFKTERLISSNVSSSTINTITFYDPTGNLFSTANSAYNNIKLSIDSGITKGETKKIISYNGITKTATLETNLSSLVSNTTTFSLHMGVYENVESIIKINSSNTIIASANISNIGKVNNLNTNDTILFNPSKPELLFNIGDSYINSISDSSYLSKKMFSNQEFNNSSGSGSFVTLTLPFTQSESNIFDFSVTNKISDLIITVKDKKLNTAFNNGEILDLAYGTRDFVLSSDSQTLTINLPDITSPFTVDVIVKISIKNADSSLVLKTKKKIQSSNTIVSLSGPDFSNGNTYVDLTNAQVYIKKSGLVGKNNIQSLFVSDVIRIKKIIDTKNPTIEPTVAMLSNPNYDVTSWFDFDNGQRDTYYDHATIIGKSGFPYPQGNILILFDYYSHDNSGDGYFNLMSYLSPKSPYPEDYSFIPSYTTKTSGITYNLKDCLDFRPSRKNAISEVSFEYTSGKGIFLPNPSIYFVCDYSFYLPRKDILVLDKNGTFNLIKGISSQTPQFPDAKDSLLLAEISLEPYTSFLPGKDSFANLSSISIKNVQYKRWTMQEISGLQSRINDLEYYTALNFLEQKALNSQVPDSLGINRFKNGILVDDFSSLSSSDSTNSDFMCCINIKKQLTASQSVFNLPLQNPSASAHLNSNISTLDYVSLKLGNGTNVFTLPYTSEIAINANNASGSISVNPLSINKYQGIVNINPPIDNWVDTKINPISINNQNTLYYYNNSDWKAVTGTSILGNLKGTNSQQIANQLNYENSQKTISDLASNFTTTSSVSPYYGLALNNSNSYNPNYSINDGFLNDQSIIPYIRKQRILISASGLKPSDKISVWFDNIKVNDYLLEPDIISLTNVTGTFNVNDVIGYLNDSSQFIPIGVVIGITTNNTTTNLQICGNFSTVYNDFSNPIMNSIFDESTGVFLRSTARGDATIKNASPVVYHASGYITSVGGQFRDQLGSLVKFYNISPGYGSFSRDYGIWGSTSADSNGISYFSPTTQTPKFKFKVPKTGTYYMKFSVDDYTVGRLDIIDASSNVTIKSKDFWESSGNNSDPSKWGTNTPYTGVESFTLNQGDYYITFSNFKNYNNNNESFDAYIAVAIADSIGWLVTGDTNELNENASLVFNTRAIYAQGTLVNNTPVEYTDSVIEMPGGGLYYTGVTKISLNALANPENDFYTGAKINITSCYVSLNPYIQQDNTQKVNINKNTFSATILSYDGITKTCTLDTAVNISLGGNVLIGGYDLTSSYTIPNTTTKGAYNTALILSDNKNNLYTDINGKFTAIFDIPDSTFTVGEKLLRIDNRTTDSDPSSATSFAQGTFTATGLFKKHTETDLSASFDGSSFNFNSSYFSQFKNIDNNNSAINNSNLISTIHDPIAQTFIFDKTIYPNGLFLHSIDLYFQTKPSSDSYPITLSIVPTTNGYPNGRVLNYSTVTLYPKDIIPTTEGANLKDDTSFTTFKFSAPVYIEAGKLYAILILSNSSDYKVFYAEKNKPGFRGESQIPFVSQVGSLFESQNGITWTPDVFKFLMMRINRCKFDISKTPLISFSVPKNLPSGKDITNTIYNSMSGTNPIHINNSPNSLVSDAYNITTTDLIPDHTNTSIKYSYLSTLKSNYTLIEQGDITPGTYGLPLLEDTYLSDGKGERIILKNKDNSFVLNATLSSSSNHIAPLIIDDGLSLFNINYNINNLELSNTNVDIINGGINCDNITVTVSQPDVYGGTQAYATANVSSGSLDYITFTNKGSGYLNPPILTFHGANSNTIQVSVKSEFSPSGGNAVCKYLTKKVIMSQGNDSQDLRVFFNAYRPLHTNIFVFCKLLNSGDSNIFENNDWILLTQIGDNINKYSKTRDDLYEYEFAPGNNNIADNYITYQNVNSVSGEIQTYNSFIQFAIKIVLTTEDKTTVPYLQNLRVLALPSGTGI